MAKKRVIIIANRQKPQACQVGRQLQEWLCSKVEIIVDNLNNELELHKIPSADFMVILGGDGTILSTIRALGTVQVPIIGVNMGKLGFLAEFSVEQFQEQFDNLLAHPRPFTRRLMLKCHITGPERADFTSPIVNEIAVTAGPPFRMI